MSTVLKTTTCYMCACRCGVRAQPGFQLLADRVRPHTAEWAEGITGIPAATIRRLAHEMGVTGHLLML